MDRSANVNVTVEVTTLVDGERVDNSSYSWNTGTGMFYDPSEFYSTANMLLDLQAKKAGKVRRTQIPAFVVWMAVGACAALAVNLVLTAYLLYTALGM